MDPSIFVRDFRQVARHSTPWASFATGIKVDATANQANHDQPIYLEVMNGRSTLFSIALPPDHARALLTSLAAALPLDNGTVISITEPFGPAPKSWAEVSESVSKALTDDLEFWEAKAMEPLLLCSFCGMARASVRPCPCCQMQTCDDCLLSWSTSSEGRSDGSVITSCRHAPKNTPKVRGYYQP